MGDLRVILGCAFLAGAVSISTAQPAQSAQLTYAHLRFEGDLDSSDAASQFLGALERLGTLEPGIVLVELSGNRARPDLLVEVLGVVQNAETTIAVSLRDGDDRSVGPGQLAIALAADHAFIETSTRVVRTLDDDITFLNPDVKDWSIVRLDLRCATTPIASSRSIPEEWLESLVAPRSDMWIFEDSQGMVQLGYDNPAGARQAVKRSKAGWTFSLEPGEVSRLFGVLACRTPGVLRRALSLRGRPIETIEIKSGLKDAHARCRVLVDQIRAAVDLADAALDVRNNRRGNESLSRHHYHAAADRAAELVSDCRSAIAEIDALTTRFPEILRMPAPPDARAPTEIGGPSRSPLSAWRGAVRDAEHDLDRVDSRVRAYRRR